MPWLVNEITIKYNRMKTSKIAIVVSVIIGIVISSCSKDRIETELKSYESMQDYFDSKKPEEQEFIIDTLGSCPITGMLGTRICVAKTSLQLPEGDSVYFPYILKLVEIYSPQDAIYYSFSHVEQNGIYSCKGQTRVRYFKNDVELSLRSSQAWELEMPVEAPEPNFNVFLGTSQEPIRFEKSAQLFDTTLYGLSAVISQTGWSAAASSIDMSDVNTLSFSSTTDNLETVTMYVYLSEYESLIHVQSAQSIAVPTGTSVSLVVMAIDSSDQLFSYTKDFVVSADTTVDVSLSETSDEVLTAVLEGL